MKYQVTEADLPQKMRQLLKDIDAGRAHCAPSLQRRRGSVASTLRCLVETAKMKGLPLTLAAESAEAMITRLEAAGWSASSISSQKTLLRHFAYETGEGVEWALGSGASDRRPIPVVLRAHHWAPYRALLPMLIAGYVIVAKLRSCLWIMRCNSVSMEEICADWLSLCRPSIPAIQIRGSFKPRSASAAALPKAWSTSQLMASCLNLFCLR